MCTQKYSCVKQEASKIINQIVNFTKIFIYYFYSIKNIIFKCMTEIINQVANEMNSFTETAGSGDQGHIQISY